MQDRVKQQSSASMKNDELVGVNKKTQDQGSTLHSYEKKMQDQVNVKSQNDVSRFQLADTPSNEEIMQDRVKQQSSASMKNDELVGSNKKTQDQASASQSACSISKNKKRLDQLEILAKSQARFNTDLTTSANKTRQFKKKNATETELHSKESNEQIIGFALDNDREIFEQEEDTKQDQKEGRRKKQQEEQQQKDEKTHKLEEKARLRTRQQSLKNKNTRLDNDNEKMIDTKSQNRQQLEAQARQRSKQQSPRNGRNRSEVKDDTVRKGVSSKAAIRSGMIEEEHIQKDVKQNQLQAESRFLKGRTALNEQQKIMADAIMKLNSSYKPSADALANTSMMLKQVYGSSISNYKGSKELLHKKSNVSVYAGRPLSIPVRVPTHPTYVEFSISKKTGDFFFGVLAVPDKGYAVDVKKLAPFAHLSGKGQNNYRDSILIDAATAPCTLQFKFENKHSTLLEQVIVNYEIKVTSPSKDLLIETRRLRAESCLQAVEDDIRSMTVGGTSVGFKEEIKKIENLIEEKKKVIDSLIEEEQRWEVLIAKMDKIPSSR